jgi:hypothetical protein
VRGVLVLAMVLLSSCTTPTVRAIDVADRLWVAGDNEAAALSYAAAADVTAESDDAVRARFFSIIARRAAGGPTAFDDTQEALRALAAEAKASPWGRLAGIYADELSQIEALRKTVLAAGADLAAMQARIDVLQADLAARGVERDELDARFSAVWDEQAQLQRTVRDLEELLENRSARVVDLERELAALKRIDMSETP